MCGPHWLQCIPCLQENNVQKVQGQLSGTKEQLHLIQTRLSNSSGAQAQAQLASGSHSNSHAQPAEPDQDFGLDQQYQNAQAYSGDQDADMEFEPPGSAGALHRDPSFDPPDMGRPGAGLNSRDEGQGAAGSEGQDQGQGDLYSPGLSAQPSESYMAEPSLHSKRPCNVHMQICITVLGYTDASMLHLNATWQTSGLPALAHKPLRLVTHPMWSHRCWLNYVDACCGATACLQASADVMRHTKCA